MFSVQRSACLPVMPIFTNSFLPYQQQTAYDVSMNQQAIHLIYPIGINQQQRVDCSNGMNGLGYIINSIPQQFQTGKKTKVNSNPIQKSTNTKKNDKDEEEDSSSKTSKTPRKKFTQEEDEKLKDLVQKMGSKKWEVIAKEMPGRTGRQCRDRYQNYLIPGFFNGQWSKQEDDLLLQKFMEYGSQWSKITPFFKNRSANALKNRWNYFVSRHLTDFPSENMQSVFVCNSINNSTSVAVSEIDDKANESDNNADIIYENIINYTNPFDFMDFEPINENNELNCKDEGHDFPYLLID